MSELVAERWAESRTFHHSRYTCPQIAAARERLGLGVSVCLPARECAETVGNQVRELMRLREQGAIDEVVVIDADSPDGTATAARDAGATVHQEAELLPGLGPVLGKGDAMYRALTVLRGDVVCYLDADNAGPCAHYAVGLIGPLICEPGDAGSRDADSRDADSRDAEPPDVDACDGQPRDPVEQIAFVKAFYRRPFEHGGVSLPDGGGRVNRLLARPALALFYPELAAVSQPLAGEIAARRDLLERVPFATGYGVEIAMLIDAWRLVGLQGIAQVDLDVHRNRHQPLAALESMARTVLTTIAARAREEGRLAGVELEAAVVERPPLAQVAAAR